MNYYKVNVKTNEDFRDILMALMADLPFDTFMETEEGFEAYIPENAWADSLQDALKDWQTAFDFSWEREWIAAQNWNEVWESNFEPIKIADFVGVRADFHLPTEGVIFDLVINPKMAFGTGHHETTYMMMQTMRDLHFQGQKVLDYGCGTGILAILAAKLGATDIEAVDIEDWSFENTLENAAINGVSPAITAFCGTLSAISRRDFDIILANINRNVILESLSTLKTMLQNVDTEGEKHLLISGFLKEDENIMLQNVAEQGFKVRQTLQRGQWLCMWLTLFGNQC